MASTTTQLRPKSKNDNIISVTEVNLGTYATGGVSVSFTQLQLQVVYFAHVFHHSVASSVANASQFVYNVDTQKIIGYSPNNTEIPNATDLSPITLRVTAYGA